MNPHLLYPTAVCVSHDPSPIPCCMLRLLPYYLPPTSLSGQCLPRDTVWLSLMSSQVSEAATAFPPLQHYLGIKPWVYLARPLLQADSRQTHYMAHSDQLCMKCADNQGLFSGPSLTDLFIALKAPHLLLRPMQGHWAKIHLSCRPSFLKRKPMVRRLRVGGVERTQAR